MAQKTKKAKRGAGATPAVDQVHFFCSYCALKQPEVLNKDHAQHGMHDNSMPGAAASF